MQGEEDSEREERTFRMWLTSLGLGLQIGNLVSLYLPISPYADRQPGERLPHRHPAAARRGPSAAGLGRVEAGNA